MKRYKIENLLRDSELANKLNNLGLNRAVEHNGIYYLALEADRDVTDNYYTCEGCIFESSKNSNICPVRCGNMFKMAIKHVEISQEEYDEITKLNQAIDYYSSREYMQLAFTHGYAVFNDRFSLSKEQKIEIIDVLRKSVVRIHENFKTK